MIPDCEAVAVAWARANPALTTLLDGRVATRLPKGFGVSGPTAAVASPFLRVFQIDGNPDGVVEAAVIGSGRLQWDAYHWDGAKTKIDYAPASLAIRTLIAEAKAAPPVVTVAGFLCGFGQILGPRRIDEPETGWARYGCDLLITVRGGTA